MVAVRFFAALAIVWLMFVEGLGLDARGLFAVVRRPLFLLRAFLVVDVLVPLMAWILILWIHPDRRIVGTIALVAACPIAPLALRRITGAGARREAAGAVHLVLSALSIVTTPATLMLLGRALGYDVGIPPLAVARLVLLVLLLPLAAGIAVRALWPSMATRLLRPAGRGALVALAVVFLLVVLTQARALVGIGIRGYAAMAAFVASALILGHISAERDPRDRVLLALEAASRNLGLAFFIASSVVGKHEALPALVPYVVVFLVVSSLYLRLFHRRWR